MPIIIDCSSCFAILFLPDLSTYFTCIDSLLYIVWLAVLFSLACILSWSLLSMNLYHFLSNYHSLYVCMSDIFCPLLDYMSHDCLSSAWLHVACLCELHFYPPTSNSLHLGQTLHSGPHYCKCDAFCVLVLWPSQRLGVGSSNGLYRCTRAFWRSSIIQDLYSPELGFMDICVANVFSFPF